MDYMSLLDFKFKFLLNIILLKINFHEHDLSLTYQNNIDY